MAAKPETTYYSAVHRNLPKMSSLYREKMANPYRKGTADVWYSGPKADLWVEYKFNVLPARMTTPVAIDLSSQQLLWIKDRLRDGRNVWVIVGTKEGGLIFRDGNLHALLTNPVVAKSAFAAALPHRKIAEAITTHCGAHA
jgi:hypothetical protein